MKSADESFCKLSQILPPPIHRQYAGINDKSSKIFNELSKARVIKEKSPINTEQYDWAIKILRKYNAK
tara:strand:+ start:173 stop:376 length:204 start_codon:yes stop_codon:yes gene_type:complete